MASYLVFGLQSQTVCQKNHRWQKLKVCIFNDVSFGVCFLVTHSLKRIIIGEKSKFAISMTFRQVFVFQSHTVCKQNYQWRNVKVCMINGVLFGVWFLVTDSLPKESSVARSQSLRNCLGRYSNNIYIRYIQLQICTYVRGIYTMHYVGVSLWRCM